LSCAIHTDREAVGSCGGCGRSLCRECYDAVKPPLCVHCRVSQNRTLAAALTGNILFGLAASALCLFIINRITQDSLWVTVRQSWLAVVWVFFVSFGWRFLTGRHWIPFGRSSFGAWLSSLLRLCASLLIGPVVFLIQMVIGLVAGVSRIR